MHLINIALNNLRRRKLKMLFVMVSVSVGIVSLVALSLIVSAIDKELADKFDQIGSNIVIIPKAQDITLSYGSVDIPGVVINAEKLSEDAIGKIFQIKEAEAIAIAAPKVLGTTDLSFNGFYSHKTLVMGIEWNHELRLKDWWYIKGRIPDEDGSVIVGNNLAEKMVLNVGDNIEINGNSYYISGILEELGTIEDEMLLMSVYDSQKILNMQGQLSMIEIAALCYTCPIDEIVEQLSHKLPEARVTAVRETIEARKMVVDRFSSIVRIILAIVILISMLIISNTVMSAVSQRTGEIGILRAIGFRKIHIASIIMMETVIISFAGGITGYLLGIAAAYFVAPVVANMEVTVRLQPVLFLQALAAAAFMGTISSIWPAIKASRLDPVTALRYF